MKVEILGDGCVKCRRLEKKVVKSLEELQRKDVEVIVTDNPERLAFYSLLTLPALAIDGKIIFQGEVPEVEKIKEYLS